MLQLVVMVCLLKVVQGPRTDWITWRGRILLQVLSGIKMIRFDKNRNHGNVDTTGLMRGETLDTFSAIIKY